MKMPIVERFISINGEGRKAGELSQFIRFAGCNLNCSYCDTEWSQSADSAVEFIEIDKLVSDVAVAGVTNVTLTGGEPMLQEGLPDVVQRLMRQGNAVEIETNGSLPLENLMSLRVPGNTSLSFTVDYKLPDSGVESAMCLANLRKIRSEDSVKFVVSSQRDLERADQIIMEYGLIDRTQVYLSPVTNRIAPQEIVEFMKQKRLNRVRLQLQLHKYIWDPSERGV